MQKILVVAVHPDDETLGCGGTLLKFREMGAELHWLIITEMKEDLGYSKEKILQRDEEINAVAEAYQFTSVNKLGIGATTIDGTHLKNLINKISEIFDVVKPTQVILPFHDDIHSDHQYVFKAAFSCTKIFRFPSIKKVMMMEALSETDFARVTSGFLPNLFVDISNHLDAKLAILSLYKGEIKEHPFPRSIDGIKALATIRGISAGSKYAESFMLLKEVL